MQQLRAEPPPLDLADVGTHLLRNLGTVPEQPNENLKKVLTTTTARFVVKPDDLRTVISEWITGIAHERIFAALPTVGRSTILPPIEDWLAGEPAPKWDDRFDTCIDFASAVLIGFLPWLFRASEALSGFASGWAVLIPLAGVG